MHYQECTVCKARLNEGAHEIDEMTAEDGKKCDEPRTLPETAEDQKVYMTII